MVRTSSPTTVAISDAGVRGIVEDISTSAWSGRKPSSALAADASRVWRRFLGLLGLRKTRVVGKCLASWAENPWGIQPG